MNRYKNQWTVYKWVNISDDLVYKWVLFSKGQVYEWGRFRNTGSQTRTKLSSLPLPRVIGTLFDVASILLKSILDSYQSDRIESHSFNATLMSSHIKQMFEKYLIVAVVFILIYKPNFIDNLSDNDN